MFDILIMLKPYLVQLEFTYHHIIFFNLADPCLRYECHGGTCTNDRGVARCVCPVGRAGSRCQGE